MTNSPTDPEQNPDGSEALSQNEIELSIEAIQSDLRGYIISLSGHGGDCDDIIQETNLFLWERSDDFKRGTSFKAWAFRIAYFKAMAYRRDQVRRGEVVFSEDIMQEISAQAAAHFGRRRSQIRALRHCLSKLGSHELSILKIKYLSKTSLTKFAKQTGKSINGMHKTISRTRLKLRSCIENYSSKHND